MSRRIVFNILFFILGATAFAAVPDTLLLHMYDNPMHHLYQVRERARKTGANTCLMPIHCFIGMPLKDMPLCRTNYTIITMIMSPI